MTCLHMSLNKMVFFICVLFIILSVGVLCKPYFSSSNYRISCIDILHSIVYKDRPECEGCTKSWSWMQSSPVAKCAFKKFEKPDASVMLNRSWVVFAGDSQTRLGMLSMLKLVEEPERVRIVKEHLKKLHTDYSTNIDSIGMKLDFKWKPYARRLTKLMLEFKKNEKYPDIIVMGAGLWDMLYETNASDYDVSLRSLRNSLQDLNSKDGKVPHLFWLAMPKLISSKMTPEEKRHKLTEPRRSMYDNKVNASKILNKFGGPLLKLDIHYLSELCGPQCTKDGVHYDDVVYDIAVQIMLNAVLIESTHKPPF
ncbi:unnamed protein product [Fraxinus pennsylvanica]|uniref:Uncharacterized protein n=1 Tax=Fraxinus pennsylvanica TaxID=56036 RepID=A0AAD1YN75_9LAMI|nr:unnamed protein product [Fraxinus pennsylvanica]